MSDLFDKLPQRRAIIDRRKLGEQLAAIAAETNDTGQRRRAMVALLKEALGAGHSEIAHRLLEAPSHGRLAAQATAFLIDQIVRLSHDFTVDHLYPSGNRSAGERITVIAVGGYGRGEMAPHSDVDIGFLTPFKQTSWTEQVIEAQLYTLWDLGLKVGHSSRSLEEMIRAAKEDLTVRTALLEGRFVWGDRDLYDQAAARFDAEVVAGNARAFVADKLAERDERHKKMGDSRYVVEPNVKEGKGGLRDLHTLFWIGKFIHRVRTVPELVDAGLLTARELRQFARAENFLLAVRCHLHTLAGRAEDRLTFDFQREIAARMQFAERPGKSAVERFMQLYFLHAKSVGDLTGTFLAHLDDQLAARGRRFLPSIRRRPGKLNGFVLDRGRLALPSDDFFEADPVRLIEIFALADKYGLEIHPQAMRQARHDAKLIETQGVRRDARANALFLDVLTSPRDPETVLRWMNEAGIFGRFVPDFGRVVAQMQFDMYHHYTVDEHTIRAIGLLADIEQNRLKGDHPLSTAIMQQIHSRRVIYMAVLLHDIAKGRGGDHSILGAELALRVCPRLGLTAAETETVSWLVRYHLLMSATAFKRDLADFKTILDFAQVVQSPERLRLLLVLTVVDIRAVGPGVWNSWKRQLLTELYDAAEEVLRLGHKQRGREQRIANKKEDAQALLGMGDKDFAKLAKRLPESYWIAEPVEVIAANLVHIQKAGSAPLHIAAVPDDDRGATLVMVLAADHPGLFYRIAGGIHLAGGNIIDARIHTTRDGLALDNFLVQDPLGRPFDEADQIARLTRAIEDALANRQKLLPKLEARALPRARAEAFRVAPNVFVDNKASNRFTVIEVNAQDRPALLNQLAHALFQSKVTVHSAHVATYGERAVDTFYVTDLLGGKIDSAARVKSLEKRLLDAAGADEEVEVA
ncbi:[protein-PII] uridylyltransferase [Sphingopyxis sp. XHP0097]|uniref:Bifunctional uridylyltransferase/uridylyl-removing enzyme n=1 Tax=Sphingopyxis jiangsuensis TaxID=2871171 RepID=A0ABS7MEJ0_9SPHN|nr:[protein-PII] uridylyltransferase [Sphingopyxis jiangsuensis]MBY4637425.1 [protein-PII] uridylyltransferase [Sphingopyxis jiangsuensis]